jgi:hypothetical protein
MDCCGFSDDDEGYKAWNQNMYFNCTVENTSAESCAVPWSCCVLNDVRKMEKLFLEIFNKFNRKIYRTE